MTTPTARDIADIVGCVGEIVGRTKLQKTVALLELTGLGSGFSFSYHLFGPYSDEVAAAVDRGVLLGMLTQEERVANWGGRYSIFHANRVDLGNHSKAELIELAAKANSIALELAVTAAFVASEGDPDAWGQVAELKPEKATQANMVKARELYREFQKIGTPKPLPAI